jgi:hypothetical protein
MKKCSFKKCEERLKGLGYSAAAIMSSKERRKFFFVEKLFFETKKVSKPESREVKP